MIENLTQARREHEEAKQACQEAQAKAGKIESRIAECRQRQQEISRARLEGESTTADAAEYSALVGDVETLTGMLAQARAEAAALLGPCDDALRRVGFLEAQSARDLAQAEIDALTLKAVQLDQALCKCISMIHQIGRAKFQHVSLSQSWRPSTELDRALRLGVSP